MKTIMAIDLGKFKSVVCLYQAGTVEHEFITIKTTPQELHDLVVMHTADIVVFEACSIIGWICDLLDELGITYRVANTNSGEWSGKRLKKKTDKRDALWLARKMALNDLPAVHVPEKKVREKRAFINQRKGLVEQINQSKNAIRSLLERQALSLPQGKSGWSQKSMKYLHSLACPLAEADAASLWRGALWAELQILEQLIQTLEQIEAKLEALNEQDAQVQLLKTIPGVGSRTAEAVAAYIDDPHRFDNCKQVGCYVGMTPRQYQSGQTDRQGRISKEGNRMLRSLLVEISWIAIRWNPWVRETYRRIRRGSKTRSKIAIVAVARRLFVRMWAMLRDGTPWQMPELQDVA